MQPWDREEVLLYSKALETKQSKGRVRDLANALLTLGFSHWLHTEDAVLPPESFHFPLGW